METRRIGIEVARAAASGGDVEYYVSIVDYTDDKGKPTEEIRLQSTLQGKKHGVVAIVDLPN